MTELNEFVNRRYEEARHQLCALIAPQTRLQLEEEMRLESVGLSPANPQLVNFNWPSLGSGWHALLEECLELSMVHDSLLTAAVLLGRKSNDGRTKRELGLEAIYHFRAWFAYALATAERLDVVVVRWIDLRLGKTSHARELKRA